MIKIETIIFTLYQVRGDAHPRVILLITFPHSALYTPYQDQYIEEKSERLRV